MKLISRTRSRTFSFYWIPVLFWVTGIFVVSSLPSGSLPQTEVGISLTDHLILHTVAFFVLFLLLHTFLMNARPNWARLTILLLCLGLTMSVSIAKELLQLTLSTRSFSLWDLGVDAGAALLGLMAARFIPTRGVKRRMF